MPRSPSTYSLPPGTTPQQPNTVISSSMFNAFADDVAQTFNTVQPIVYGGTGSNDLKLTDTDFGIKDNGDPTKIGQFNASGIPTGTTRTYDLPYSSGTLGLVSDIRGYVFGLNPTNDAGDPTNDIALAAGSAVDSAGTVSMLLASSMIKRVDATFTAGTNQGGRFYTTLIDGTIYIYLIRNPNTGVVDWGYSDNATVPTGGASYPSGFTQYAVVGKFARVAGVNKAPRLLSVNVTDWISYPATITGFDGVSGSTIRSRRVGSSIEIEGRWSITAGNAGDSAITMGFDGVNGNLATFYTGRHLCGTCISSVAAAWAVYVTINPTTNQLNLGLQSSTREPFTTVPGNVFGASAAVISFTARVPILGW